MRLVALFWVLKHRCAHEHSMTQTVADFFNVLDFIPPLLMERIFWGKVKVCALTDCIQQWYWLSGGRKKFPTCLIFWYLLVFSCYLLVTECHCSRVQDPQSLTPGHKSLQETQTALFLSCRSMPPVCISVWIIIKVWELASVLLPSADSFWLFWKYFSCTHTVAVAVIQSLWKQSFLLYLLFA